MPISDKPLSEAEGQANEDRLSEIHPDWIEVVQSPAFVGWVRYGSQDVRDTIAANGDCIVDVAGVAAVLAQFKQLPADAGAAC